MIMCTKIKGRKELTAAAAQSINIVVHHGIYLHLYVYRWMGDNDQIGTYLLYLIKLHH